METAVVHDGTIHPGGAVNVVTEAAHALDADLYIGFSGKDWSWWETRVPNEVTLLRKTSRSGTLNDIRTARSILNLDLREYDLVLSSGPATKFFQPYDDQLHVHYLHHPPLASLWFTGGLFSYLVKIVDRIETSAIPHLIANSELTSTRVFRQYGQGVDRVIPPPVDVEQFSSDTERVESQLVMVGRLEDRKRPRVAVNAMQELPDCTLKLVGDGPLREEIERTAPSNVDILGYVDDQTLRSTIEESAAGVFLAEREDFGITPIEYMAAGTPVVGVDEPNTNNQVDEDTGVLVEPTPEAVVTGIQDVLRGDWDRQVLRNRSYDYSTERFRADLREFVETVYF
ncbi:glycosyltransferase [Halobacterium sp. R2-5]|uniref:glycosyltransferase n=1 Tax=Halobacterium sp. R2-5 TaxID=2715751 RepID=UPI00141F14FA|nr:glycosyltransferase [Halobacterium sp. R2-5]NIB99459.1 glycosyltransferase family 4 protein [Halobacterium sp. R2-5]